MSDSNTSVPPTFCDLCGGHVTVNNWREHIHACPHCYKTLTQTLNAKGDQVLQCEGCERIIDDE